MMGQRSKGHVFMPDKWVFPGGRVDPGDARAKAAHELTAETEALLRKGSVAAGRRARLPWPRPGRPGRRRAWWWAAQRGPDLSKLELRRPGHHPAVPPPPVRRPVFHGRRRAPFWLHDEPAAGEELLHTRWFSLDEAEALDLPSITRFVLKEVAARLAGEAVQPPFLRWSRGGAHARAAYKLTLGRWPVFSAAL